MSDKITCKDCRDSLGTTAKTLIYCQLIKRQVPSDKVMPCLMRAERRRGNDNKGVNV